MKTTMKTTMKNKITAFFVALVLMLGLAPAAMAQTATYQTVTSAAMTATATQVTLASMSNMVASTQTVNSYLFCDGEAMKINSINTTSLVAQVTRGALVTNASAHATAMPCFYGVQGGTSQSQLFVTQDQNGFGGNSNRAPQSGAVCTRTNYLFLPLINVQNNSLIDCVGAQTGTALYRWRTTSLAMMSGASPMTSVNDAAYTITLSDRFVRTANITVARTFTLPPVTGIVGHEVIVKHDGTGATLTVATPANQFVTTVGTTSTTLTQGGVLRLISVYSQSGAWGWATW